MTRLQHVLLSICAVHCFGFALFHLSFPRIFRWRQSMAEAGRANGAILRIENGLLVYLFLVAGVACLAWPEALATTDLGRGCLMVASGFWCVRLVQQFVYLRINRPMVHILSLLFAAGSILFGAAAFL